MTTDFTQFSLLQLKRLRAHLLENEIVGVQICVPIFGGNHIVFERREDGDLDMDDLEAEIRRRS